MKTGYRRQLETIAPNIYALFSSGFSSSDIASHLKMPLVHIDYAIEYYEQEFKYGNPRSADATAFATRQIRGGDGSGTNQENREYRMA